VIIGQSDTERREAPEASPLSKGLEGLFTGISPP